MRSAFRFALAGLCLAAAIILSSPPAGAVTRLSGDALSRLAREWLEERLPADADRARIEVVGVPRDLVLPDGEVTTSVSLQAGSLAGGPVTLLVEALVTEPTGARSVRSATIGLRVNAERSVVVAVRDLPRRSILHVSDVRVERRPVERIPPGALGDARDVVGKEVARPVAPGEALTASAVTPVIAVRRGAAVTLLLEGPGFRIAARGVASEDGAAGQMIRVVNQASRREVVGRVEDERTVRIPF